MLAKVSNVSGEQMGIHRTVFDKDGYPLSKSNKMMLGRCHGGAVKLTAGQESLVVEEALEPR